MRPGARAVLAAVLGLALSLSVVSAPLAYTDKEIIAIFRILDTNGDGKVTREEYSATKVMALYRNRPAGDTSLTFEETKVSREFFDRADVDHDGTLSPVEAMDALPFEAIDTDNKGYITLDDLRRLLNRIGR